MTERLRALIVDNSLAAIETMNAALVRAGFSEKNIFKTRSFSEAQAIIENQNIDFLLLDFLIEGRPGLDLVQKHCALGVAKMAMIVTYNNSSSAIAEAAEELVDDYIIKPFFVQNLQERIEGLLKRKLFPPKYIEEIRKGKQFLLENKFEAAQFQFQSASFLDSKPTLAYYYMGQTSFFQNEFSKAIGDYQRGLEFRPLHFKCLTGQFDSYFEQKKFHEAYEMVPQLVQNYPLGPKRLCHLFVAAVYSGRLDEVSRYYDLFLQIEHVTPELRRVFSAALFVAGRFYLNRKDLNQAVQCFEYGLQVVGADAHYIEKIVRVLVRYGAEASGAASKFLRKYPGDQVGGATHSVLSYLVSQYFRTPQQMIEMGRHLAQKNYADQDSYRLLVDYLLKEGKQLLAEDYSHRASKLFPQWADRDQDKDLDNL